MSRNFLPSWPFGPRNSRSWEHSIYDQHQQHKIRFVPAPFLGDESSASDGAGSTPAGGWSESQDLRAEVAGFRVPFLRRGEDSSGREDLKTSRLVSLVNSSLFALEKLSSGYLVRWRKRPVNKKSCMTMEDLELRMKGIPEPKSTSSPQLGSHQRGQKAVDLLSRLKTFWDSFLTDLGALVD